MKNINYKNSENKKLNGKEILLGICGGIAAYKVPSLIRKLKSLGANITCILTENGAKFVTPLTLQTLSNNRVYEDMFDRDIWEVEHVALAKKADIIVVVPATADIISRLSYGRAEELLSCVVLASKAPILICPAMNENMWNHSATQENIGRLKRFGYNIINPEKGKLACDDEGIGRLADLEKIVSEICNIIG
ncbi:MAG: hypothetical protein NT145_03420 [Elusimicrobia bacterium]|nr:hypothetical protein [Elusimicrobiota bacterium]